ncbi:MAG TPA: CRISPR-associated helicase Cas3' [Caulobacteraceae bacterium]|nr:CRISPR-associated helicase Cas3' [Caulobacteraceae bacterium]
MFAHSAEGRPPSEWEPLSHHLARVGQRAASFAEAFGWAEAARVAGRLHDIGKCSAEFQAYISHTGEDSVGARGPDHSTAGAREVAKAYKGPLGRMLAFAIAGHHAGLADFDGLDRRLTEKKICDFSGWEVHAGKLPTIDALRPRNAPTMSREAGFTQAFLARMIFSCLVDADFLETERYYASVHGETVERGGHQAPPQLLDRLRGHMGQLRLRASDTPLNRLRNEIRDHAVGKAPLAPGLFTLTAPTGSGKTLASLAFALEHAVRHGLQRVIYVIPYTSIIEQTAQVFREALETDADVLEHHSSFDWEKFRSVPAADSEGPDGLRKLRRAAENWEAPVIVTTAVQFFESLFAARTSQCRKLHNMARSVIILDEAQTLPIHVVRPCLAALDELARNYRASVVICTATQPAWRQKDRALVDRAGRNLGLEIENERELAPRPAEIYEALRRVRVEWRHEAVTDAAIAERFVERPQILCIVNSRRHARSLFETIREQAGATHLTTLMCAQHRRLVLQDVRGRLAAGKPVRLVATSLVEAGVDLDFPEVWRAAAGLDSVAQAAGRCNREGKAASGLAVVFEPADEQPPHDLKVFYQAARPVLRKFGDPLCLPAVRAYFRELYFQKGDAALDAPRLEGEVFPILRNIADRGLDFTFQTVARAFSLIQDAMEPVAVPFDDRGEALLDALSRADRPTRAQLRELQQYLVPIPNRTRGEWLAAGLLHPIHPRLGEALLKLRDMALYEERTGLQVVDKFQRAAESNIIS